MVVVFIIRGLERIRTAVEGFADLCLATRPRDHNMWLQSYKYLLFFYLYTVYLCTKKCNGHN